MSLRVRGCLPSWGGNAVLESALVAAGFAVVFFLLPHELSHDDLRRLDDIERLRHDGELSESKYSLVMPLLSVPLLALGDIGLGSVEWWAERFNVVVVALGTLVTYGLLRGRVDAGVLRKCVLVLLFASLLTNRLRDYNAEVLTATLTVVGIVLLATGRSRLVGWALIVVGAANTPGVIGGLAGLSAAETVRLRRLRHVLPVFAAGALIMVEAWIRRGHPLDTGYQGDQGVETILPYSGEPGYSYPFVLGVLSILFSFGRGLAFFTPGLLLWLSRRTRRLVDATQPLVFLMLVFLGGLVVMYAKWWAWYGGITWGPRFFVFAAVPASVAIAVRIAYAGRSAAADAVTLLVLALSAWVAASGAIADEAALALCQADNYALESLCWYVPEFSSLWRPFLDFPSVTPAEALVLAYIAIVVAYLAAPLCASLVKAAGRAREGPSPAEGWRF